MELMVSRRLIFMLLLAQKILDNLHAPSLGIPLVKGNSRTERHATLGRLRKFLNWKRKRMSQKLQLNSPRKRFAANGLAAANPLALARMIRLRDPGGYLGNSAGRFMQNTKVLARFPSFLPAEF